MKTKNILIDTSVILDGLENITSLAKDSNIFITDIVLRELDANKGAEGAKGYNAREFFRQFNSNAFTALEAMPMTEKPLKRGDTLTQGSINSGAHVFTLARKWYRSKDINDTKIIEITNDYDLKLCTLDQAQSARAKSIGAEAEVYRKEKAVRANVHTVLWFTIVIAIIFSILGFFSLLSLFIYLSVIYKVHTDGLNKFYSRATMVSFIIAILFGLIAHDKHSLEHLLYFAGWSGFFAIIGGFLASKSGIFFEYESKPLNVSKGNRSSLDDSMSINPATGYPMVDSWAGGVDAFGHTFGSSH